jgi:hypothetical protein
LTAPACGYMFFLASIAPLDVIIVDSLLLAALSTLPHQPFLFDPLPHLQLTLGTFPPLPLAVDLSPLLLFPLDSATQLPLPLGAFPCLLFTLDELPLLLVADCLLALDTFPFLSSTLKFCLFLTLTLGTFA